jgi:hypothetical protein
MSDFQPILPKDFDASKVTFAYAKAMSSGAKLFFLEYDGSPLYVQSPEMSVTFDPQVYEDGPDAKFNIKTNLNLSNETCKIFHDKMLDFDERIKSLAKENSKDWFKKKNLSDDVVESMFTPTVKVYIDPDSGEPTGRYPPSFGFKVKKKENKIQCRCFTEDKQEINFNDKESENYMEFTKCLKKNSQVKGLFKCDFVWHSPGKFGCTWSAQQLRVKVAKGFDEYAFMDDSDDEEVSEKLQQGNYVESDSEEEVVEAA